MELVALYKRVIGLDIHQAQITACALIEEPDGSARIEQRQFGAFKRKRLSIGVIAGWSAMRYRSAGGFRRSAASTGAV